MVELATTLYTQMITCALPVAIVFEIGNLICGSFLRAAFGGKLWLGVK